MSKEQQNKFLEWFKKQFGQVPNVAKTLRLKDELAALEQKTAELQRQLAEQTLLREKWDGALKARMAAQSNFSI